MISTAKTFLKSLSKTQVGIVDLNSFFQDKKLLQARKHFYFTRYNNLEVKFVSNVCSQIVEQRSFHLGIHVILLY